MIRWGYIHEIRPFNKSTPICLNRCFWAITSCPQRTRGIEILMGLDYGRRCRPVLTTDILLAKWPEGKKKGKKGWDLPTEQGREKKQFEVSYMVLALLKFTCMCICKRLYLKRTSMHTQKGFQSVHQCFCLREYTPVLWFFARLSSFYGLLLI